MFCLVCTDTKAMSTGAYKHQYTLTFNISVLSQKKHHPNYAQLFLHVHTHQNPVQIKIVSDHLQQPLLWTQPSQSNGKDDSKMDEVKLVKITLDSLAKSSMWQNDSIVTLSVTSTNVIRMPLKNHYQTSVGLVLYMGGAPEAIDKLLTTPIPKAHHTNSHRIGATKRSTTGSTPCQLQSGFTVRFSEVKGGFERTLRPKTVDIGRCIGTCPHFLHHLHNPSEHAEVRNLLAFQEGSASSNIKTASCVPTSFKPLPVMVFNSAENRITQGTYNELVATSCGCR